MKSEIYDTRAWLVWVLAGAAVTMAARNPMYSVLLLLASRAVEWSNARPDSAFNLRLGRLAAIRMAALILLFSGLFGALFVHAGDTILITLPETIPLVGGAITLDAFVSGLANGLLLLTLLSFFLAFNRVVTADRLARLAPRAFQDLGVVVLVALTYVPETARHVQRIREAQAVRGHRIERLRDWRPLLIPLLVGGLERAMVLAEAMVARGFGATRRAPVSSRLLAGLALAMGLTFGGWIAALWWAMPGWLLMGGGLLLMGGVVWSAGRNVSVTHYRRRPWHLKDTVLTVASLAPVAALLLPLNLVDRQSLSINFLGGLRWPAFDPFIGFLLLLYALPAIATLFGEPAAFEERL